MTARVENQIPVAMLHEAALWHARLSTAAHADADVSLWTELTLWLEADAQHRVAFEQVEDIYATIDEFADDLADMPDSMPDSTKIEPVRPIWMRRPWRFGGAIALMACAAILLWTMQPPPTQRYATQIGQTRQLTLADGSIVTLNTGSAIAVRFTAHQRRIHLDRGEVLFRVAANPARPLIVTVGNLDVRDIGTVFDVLRTPQETVITVAEGRVAASPAGSSVAGVQLAAGDRFVQTDDTAGQIAHVDPALVAPWTTGYLVYNHASLSQVVDDLNRYFPQRILLQDSETGALPFSGALKIDSEQNMLGRLTKLMPLRADRAADGSIALSRVSISRVSDRSVPGGN